jgi:hypothetical protein
MIPSAYCIKKYAPSSYTVTPYVIVIETYRLADSWRIGINFEYETVRPYTPVVGAIYRP